MSLKIIADIDDTDDYADICDKISPLVLLSPRV